MSAGRPALSLRPELCDRCGRCVRACPQGKLRVASGYIYVDMTACTGCLSCARTCSTGAIQGRGKGDGLARPLVASRAEAKALRRESVEAARAKVPVPEARRAVTASTSSWSLSDAALFASVLAVAIAARAAVMDSAWLEAMSASSRMAVRAVVLAVFYAAQFAFLDYLARRKGTTVAASLGLWPIDVSRERVASFSAMVVAAILVTRVASTAWGAAAQAVGWEPPHSEGLTAIFGQGGGGLVLAVIMVVLAGPVIEEMVFRGVIQRALSERVGMGASILLTAALFSVYHLTAWVVVPTFVLGLVLGWLAGKKESLWAAIVVHAGYNAVVVAGAFYLAR